MPTLEEVRAEPAAPNRQIELALRLVSDRSCAVLSLDVFDTVLWRRVPRPTDAFGMLGSRLRERGWYPSWITDATFRRMRIEAEHRARRRSATHEVSLFDIWREMPLFGDVALGDLVRQEVELERELTIVDLDIADLIAVADKNGVPIVLVSDTYFTEAQLSHLLDRPELEPLAEARTFRSHQHGLDKASGLWKIVLQELGKRPEQVVHLGDNEEADGAVPAELGVRTIHYTRIDPGFARMLEREREPQDHPGPLPVDTRHGDHGLTSLRAKVLQSAPRGMGTSARTSWRFGAAVLGPPLAAFAEWVAHRAHTAGHPVVWCPMREGELLSELVNNAARTRGWDVTAKPVWLSRHVTSIAALDCFDHDSVRDLIRRSYRLTVAQLLDSLKLRPGDVPCLAHQLDASLSDSTTADQVTLALTETPHLRSRLAATVTAARERLLRSLHEAGALARPELPLVDLGWGGTIQWQLHQVLHRSRTGVRPSGFYLATDERAANRIALAGLRAEGYLGQSGHPRDIVDALCRSPEVVEQCASALCGSLVDFDVDGAPVLGPSGSSRSQALERQAVQEGVVAFQECWNRYALGADGEWPLLDESAAPRLARILGSALRAPTDEEAAVFGNWSHEDNFGSSVVTRILPEDLVSAVPYLSPHDLDDLHMRDAFWPALLAASDRHLSSAVRALHNGTINPDAFESSGPARETRLRVRTADDEWWDGPRQRVRINHNGLSFARLGFESDGATDVSLAIPGQAAIVRVDWIEAKVFHGDDPAPRVLRWEAAEDFAGLTFAECTWLGGTMVEFHAPHSALWIPLAAGADTPVTSGQITIAFAMLPQSASGLAPRMPTGPRLVRLAGRAHAEYRSRGVTGVAAGAARIAIRRLRGRP